MHLPSLFGRLIDLRVICRTTLKPSVLANLTAAAARYRTRQTFARVSAFRIHDTGRHLRGSLGSDKRAQNKRRYAKAMCHALRVKKAGRQSESDTTFLAVVLLSGQRRPADSFTPEVKTHVNMVGDLDERNAFVHPVILAVEDHLSFDLA